MKRSRDGSKATFTTLQASVSCGGAAVFPPPQVPAHHVSICTAVLPQLLGAPLSGPHPEQADLPEQVAPSLHVHFAVCVHVVGRPQSEGAVRRQSLGLSSIPSESALKGAIDVDVRRPSSTGPSEADGVPRVLLQGLFEVLLFSEHPHAQLCTSAAEAQLRDHGSWSFVCEACPLSCNDTP